MSDYDNSGEQDENIVWQHLDYYVRCVEGALVLVQTLLKQMPGQEPHEAEITTFYIEPKDLDTEWAEAVLEQGGHLAEGKSCDFIPPDEFDYPIDDPDEDELARQ